MMETKTNAGLFRAGSPYSTVECEEIINKLEALLDGALDPAGEHDIMEMVNSCEYCFEQYKIEKSIRRLIKEGFHNLAISTSLVKNIKDKIKEFRAEGYPSGQA
jgi:anti-sigma factor (TIGR02949 family)